MNAEAKKQLMTYLATGHRHESMTSMWACKYCGDRFQKGKNFFERMVREKPELFEYKPPELKPDAKTSEMYGKLIDRIKKDKLYRRHVERLAYGTEEEKDEEIAKSNSGFYRKNYGN